MRHRPTHPDADRLEGLWAGEFGDAYLERNRSAGRDRGPFWDQLLARHPAQRVLEVGCNVGANLQWIVGRCDDVYGVDVNDRALDVLRDRLPKVNAVRAQARELPFDDGWFDLVFTAGVLIHQPDSTLPAVIGEIVRVSRHLVLSIEYAATETQEVEYRSERGALIKRDYKAVYRKLFPALSLLETGFLGADEGWDDVTWWLFEKP